MLSSTTKSGGCHLVFQFRSSQVSTEGPSLSAVGAWSGSRVGRQHPDHPEATLVAYRESLLQYTAMHNL